MKTYSSQLGVISWVLVAAIIFALGNYAAHSIKNSNSNLKTAAGIIRFFRGFITGLCVGFIHYLLTIMPVFGVFFSFVVTIYYSIVVFVFVLGVSIGIAAGALLKNWRILNNSSKIFIGNFYIDENRNGIESIFQGISRHTWEILQTAFGNSFAQIRNLFVKQSNVEYFGGVVLLNRTVNNNFQGGMTLGCFVLGTNISASTNSALFIHEYGHTLQSQYWGFLYMFFPALFSGIDMLFAGKKPCKKNPDYVLHDIRWFETGPNRKSAMYFKKYFNLTWDDAENPRSKEIAIAPAIITI